jgi:hypothetical protein
VQDGIGSAEEAPDVSSLGSLYYEPIWIFYRGPSSLTRFSQFAGKKIAIGRDGTGTQILARRLLSASGVTEKNAKFQAIESREAADELKRGTIDAALFVRTPDDPLVVELIGDKDLRLMSIDQAEAIARKTPFLHHLVLPHGAIDLGRNLPEKDIDLVSPTATLVVKDSVHSALIYLLLKAATQVHSEPGLLEKKGEFPIDKDYEFPLADEAKHFYKSGVPFWQRYLPFWLATLVDRFIILVIPALALALPLLRSVPRFLEWRVKNKIYRRYGELKFLETQIKSGATAEIYREQLNRLEAIEERVHQMKIPLNHSEHIYSLRSHIDFVRQRLQRALASP